MDMDSRGGILTGNGQVRWYSDRTYYYKVDEIGYGWDIGRRGAADMWFLLDLCCRDGVLSEHGQQRWDAVWTWAFNMKYKLVHEM